MLINNQPLIRWMPVRLTGIALCLLLAVCCQAALVSTQPVKTPKTCKAYNQSAARMLQIYQALINRYQAQPLVLEHLKADHNAWLQYQLIHMKAVHPQLNYDPQNPAVQSMGQNIFLTEELIRENPNSGIESACLCMELTRMIKVHTIELKTWSHGRRDHADKSK